MDFDKFADAAFGLWGLHGTSLLVTLVAISMLSQLVARLIPEDAVGWKGVTRKIAKVIGLYASNKITTGISAMDVVKAAVHSGAVSVESVQQAKEEIPPEPVISPELPPELPELVLGPEDRAPVIPAFPGLQRRPDAGDFPPPIGDES